MITLYDFDKIRKLAHDYITVDDVCKVIDTGEKEATIFIENGKLIIESKNYRVTCDSKKPVEHLSRDPFLWFVRPIAIKYIGKVTGEI